LNEILPLFRSKVTLRRKSACCRESWSMSFAASLVSCPGTLISLSNFLIVSQENVKSSEFIFQRFVLSRYRLDLAPLPDFVIVSHGDLFS
jgi:hypothetical protein